MAIDRYRAEFSLDEMDTVEAREVEELIASSQESITDPVDWMEIDQILRGNVIVDSITNVLDKVINWGRHYATWPFGSGLACCAMEMVPTAASRFDQARFGVEIFRASPRQADLLIVAGTLTWKMARGLSTLY